MSTMASDPDFDDKEQAEGERETVDEALRRRRQASPDRPGTSPAQQGITNRALAEEQREPADLPSRGEARDEGDRG